MFIVAYNINQLFLKNHLNCSTVTLKEDPVISGALGSVQFGEDALLNCSTSPAMPPAIIVWYVDGIPEKVSAIRVPFNFITLN